MSHNEKKLNSKRTNFLRKNDTNFPLPGIKKAEKWSGFVCLFVCQTQLWWIIYIIFKCGGST